MNNYAPVTDERIAELREQASGIGMSRQQVQQIVRDLERAERERARLAREIDGMRSGRMAMRETFLTELHDVQQSLAHATGLMEAAKEAWSTSREALERVAHNPSPDVERAALAALATLDTILGA